MIQLIRKFLKILEIDINFVRFKIKIFKILFKLYRQNYQKILFVR